MGKKIPELDELCHLSICGTEVLKVPEWKKNQVTEDQLFSPFTGTALITVLYSLLKYNSFKDQNKPPKQWCWDSCGGKLWKTNKELRTPSWNKSVACWCVGLFFFFWCVCFLWPSPPPIKKFLTTWDKETGWTQSLFLLSGKSYNIVDTKKLLALSEISIAVNG